MKKYIFSIAAIMAILFTSCDDLLNRPQLNSPSEDNFWHTELDLRLYSNYYYPNYFIGYAVGYNTNYSPLRGFTFDDNVAHEGKMSSFENSIPPTRVSSNEGAVSSYLSQYVGPAWNFTWIRRSNIFLNRLETRMKNVLSEEAYNHWHAVASFYKCFSYARLMTVFGDIPYFEKEFTEADKDIMFKDRDSRVFVMDKLYDMLKNDVLVNMRTNDGDNMLNRYVAAAFASRWLLFEGTWQKYHNGDQAAATRYLTLAKEAAEIVINSGKYKIDQPLRTLFGSQDLKGNKEALMYRHFDFEQKVTHSVASYCNGIEGQGNAANLSLIKSFICQDGKTYQHSDLENAKVLSMANLVNTRDPRFEATFINEATSKASTLLYTSKFIDRDAFTLGSITGNPLYNNDTNTNDAPVIRYAEVLLNWIEAKAELNEVIQTDIDKSINQLRRRPLDATAKAKGMKNTTDMKLSNITENFDPARDADVTPLVWEIRRERRMEFVFEHCRLHDIKRWKKLEYMNNQKYPDTMLGPWVNIPNEVPDLLKPQDKGKRQVMKEDGTIITFDGTNSTEMVGYFIPNNIQPRDLFTDRSYCSPIGLRDIQFYKDNGNYTLTQTKDW